LASASGESKERLRLEKIENKKTDTALKLKKVLRSFNKPGIEIQKESTKKSNAISVINKKISKINATAIDMELKIFNLEQDIKLINADVLDNLFTREAADKRINDKESQIEELRVNAVEARRQSEAEARPLNAEKEALQTQIDELEQKFTLEAKNAAARMREYNKGIEAVYNAEKEKLEKMQERGNKKPVELKKQSTKVELEQYNLKVATDIADRADNGNIPRKVETLFGQIWMNRLLYFLILPSFIMSSLFSYWPMYGILMAFTDFDVKKGILGSPWVGLKNFQDLGVNVDFLNAARNTVIIMGTELVLHVVICVFVAIMLNEMKNMIFRRTVQTLIYIPHFLSWVIIGTFAFSLFGTSGALNQYLSINNMITGPINFLGDPRYFRFVLYIADIWKRVGWGSIIYLAAIIGVNPALYESAIIDGAGRLKQILFVTIPSIKGTIIILLIMGIGGLFAGGFDQVYNLATPPVMDVALVIEWYVLRTGIQQGSYSVATAIGFVQSLIGLALVLMADRLAKLLGEDGLF
jgi:putative aldouronate transport system permease protein